ncbi:MAG: coenzyme F420-0:L-glutamate ligase [bacterium]
MQVKAVKTQIFKIGDNLIQFIKKNVASLDDGSILVVTSKIIALSQKRVVDPKGADWDKLIQQESQWAIPTKYCYLTLKDNMVAPNAGIDRSNANGKWILWPRDSFGVAEKLQKILSRYYKIKNLGILITDSRTSPLRKGITGVALAHAGFNGLRNYIGRKDIFGRYLEMSKTNIADSLATAAVLLMGEADERAPLAVITGAPVKFTKRVNKKELFINIKDDIYRPFFDNLIFFKKQR